MAKFWQF